MLRGTIALPKANVGRRFFSAKAWALSLFLDSLSVLLLRSMVEFVVMSKVAYSLSPLVSSLS